MAHAPTIGEQLLQHLTLGLQEGQHEIDVHDEVQTQPTLPREDGYLVNRQTGELVETPNTYPFDNPYIESLTAYKTILANDPDFQLVRVVGGLMSIDPFELVRGDSHARFQRVSQTIRDVLRDNMKKRGVTVGQRRELITTLSAQQTSLQQVRDRLQAIYETMAPTVKRWAFLASITGYRFDPEIAPDADFRALGDEADPVPYWLLVRYVRQQYTTALKTRDFAVHDALYWEAYRPEFQWTLRLLQLFQQTILHVLNFDDTQRELANRLYLFLRDVVLSKGLRLVPPIVTGTAPVAAAPTISRNANQEDITTLEWLRPLDSETSTIGRYHSLAYYLEQTRATLADNLNPINLRLHAVTRAEAIAASPGPDAFELTANVERQRILSTVVAGAITKDLAARRFVSEIISGLTGYTIAALQDALKTGRINTTFLAWIDQCNRFADSLGGFNLEGLGNWIRVVRSVLAPPNTPTAVAAFLFQIAQTLIVNIGQLNGRASFSWTRDGATLANTVPDQYTASLLIYLLLHRKEGMDLRIPRSDTRETFTRVALGSLNGVDVLDITSHVTSLDNTSTALSIKIPITRDTRADWEGLVLVSERLVDIMEVRPRNKVREALDVCLASLLLWSRLMQNTRVADGFVHAVYTDLFTRDAAVMLQKMKKRAPSVEVFSRLLVELNRYNDASAHFYHEVFRSTFLSPYDRKRITVKIEPRTLNTDVYKGDILEGAVFTRADKGNDTAFDNGTWEKLYVNLFHIPVDEVGYWRTNLKALLPQVPDDTRDSVFSALWSAILATPRYWSTSPANDQGVPDFTQLRLALTAADAIPTQEAIVQQAFYQSLAYTLRTRWNRAIIPDRLRQTSVLEDNDASESIPSIDLLHHMIIFTLAYYPHMRERMLTRQSELDKSIADANDFLRSVAANDHNYAVSQVNDMIRNLYVPEREWHMQGLLTGHLEIVAMVTSALGYAYNALQDLAYKTASESDRNEYNKRARSLTLDYSNLKEIPLDVISAYNGKDATRDRIDDTYTTESTLGQLRNTIGELIKQCICHTRLDVPEQYKTMIQYERSPIGLSNALRAMLRFRFTSLGARLWKVDRV